MSARATLTQLHDLHAHGVGGGNPHVRVLADKVRAMIAAGRVSPFSVIEIVRAVVATGASWDIVEDVVEEIAKGADGIGGTADDLIPQSVLGVMLTLLRTGAVRDLVSWVAALSRAAAPAAPPQSWWRRLACRG